MSYWSSFSIFRGFGHKLDNLAYIISIHGLFPDKAQLLLAYGLLSGKTTILYKNLLEEF